MKRLAGQQSLLTTTCMDHGRRPKGQKVPPHLLTESVGVTLVTMKNTVTFLAVHPHPSPLIIPTRQQNLKLQSRESTGWFYSQCSAKRTEIWYYVIFCKHGRQKKLPPFKKNQWQFTLDNGCHLEIPLKLVTYSSLFEGRFWAEVG